MTEHIKVEKSFIESLVEGAAWDAARLTITEKKAPKQEMKEADEEEDLDPSGTKKEESVEEHSCPLCESVLAEELSDEVIFEHVAQIQEALKTLEEKKEVSEDDDDDVEPTDDDLNAIEKEEESRSSKKEAVMSKVKELKAAAKGK
jgi:hypothetical protein